MEIKSEETRKNLAQRTWDVVVLSLVGLAIRLLWLRFGAWMQNDSHEYMRIARNLITYGTFSLGDGGTPSTAIRPPLFPAMIAALWHGESEPVAYVLLANTILGSLTVGLTYLIARDKFDRGIAIIAAGLLAFAPMTSLFTVTVLTEALFTFLVVLAIYLWGRGTIIGAGAVFGAAALTRPSILPFLAVLPLLALLPSCRQYFRSYLMLLLVASSVASFWMIRNAVVFGQFIPVASSGWGLNLLCGTLETDTGGRVWNGEAWAPLDFKTNPVTRVDDVTDESEVDAIRMNRALTRIWQSPGTWLMVRAKQYPKLFIDNGDYLLGPANLPLREAFSEARWSVIIVKLAFIGGNLLIIVLAGIGLWILGPRLGDYGSIVLFPIFGMLVHLPMWIEPRYFVPMMPMIFILAVVGIQKLSLDKYLFWRSPRTT